MQAEAGALDRRRPLVAGCLVDAPSGVFGERTYLIK